MQIIRASARMPRVFTRPRLHAWSIEEADGVEVTGSARADYERELRISAIGMLVCSPASTSLWRLVCKAEMYREIRARSAEQRIAMELAILEATR
jgi:hypothetical protein